MVSLFVTTRSFELPAGSAGATAVSEVLEPTTMPVAGTPPIVTAAPFSKSVPATVMVVPPAASPEVGRAEKGSRCENSEVLPEESVAVTEMREPLAVAGSVVTLNVASPEPSVVTGLVPR